jgi:phosphonoacetaldehyde hydrolase
LYAIARRYRGSISAVILDWAGTAIDYGSFVPIAVFLRLFAGRGVVIMPEDARAGMGLMKKDHLRTILARPTVRSAWQSVHGAPPSEPNIDGLFEQFIPLQTAVLKEYAEPIPSVIEATVELRKRGVKIGSTTGYLRAMMATLAPIAAAYGYHLDCIVCPDDVPTGRPAPWMCFMNAMRLGVYPMAALIEVGDTPVDIEEGLNAGMRTVGGDTYRESVGKDVRRRGSALPTATSEYPCADRRTSPGIWSASGDRRRLGSALCCATDRRAHAA